jgi:hypothetical protein
MGVRIMFFSALHMVAFCIDLSTIFSCLYLGLVTLYSCAFRLSPSLNFLHACKAFRAYDHTLIFLPKDKGDIGPRFFHPQRIRYSTATNSTLFSAHLWFGTIKYCFHCFIHLYKKVRPQRRRLAFVPFVRISQHMGNRCTSS